MKYLESNLVCVNVVSLPLSNMILHMKFLKQLDKHKNKNCCSYIYELK